MSSSPDPVSSDNAELHKPSEEQAELISELEILKERLTKLKGQEQAVVDEEEALMTLFAKLRSAVEKFLREDRENVSAKSRINRLWMSIKGLRPFRSPLLLTLSLGHARYVLPEKQRLRYKKEYEQFKLVTVAVHFGLCAVQLLLPKILFLDSISNFHLLYYYSTLTLRENILVANGSHIRPWWIAHHYLCVVIAAVLLIWPSGIEYYSMKQPLLLFSVYVSGIQVLQYRYQMHRLYTLRALARVDPMQITTESASVHVRNELAFLLPFLLIGHLWQFYISYRFAILDSMHWHTKVLSALFLAIGIGNLSAVLVTAYQKRREI